MVNIESFARSIISKHKFSSNSNTGFSCYIADTIQHDPNGFIVWVYSVTHRRIETHFQNLFSANRLNLITQFKITADQYQEEMSVAVAKFILELDSIPEVHEIGKGIGYSTKNNRAIHNRAISFLSLEKDNRILGKLETVLTDNSLIDYICTLKANTNYPFTRM